MDSISNIRRSFSFFIISSFQCVIEKLICKIRMLFQIEPVEFTIARAIFSAKSLTLAKHSGRWS